jgi:hypothetical protein
MFYMKNFTLKPSLQMCPSFKSSNNINLNKLVIPNTQVGSSLIPWWVDPLLVLTTCKRWEEHLHVSFSPSHIKTLGIHLHLNSNFLIIFYIILNKHKLEFQIPLNTNSHGHCPLPKLSHYFLSTHYPIPFTIALEKLKFHWNDWHWP